MDVFESKLLNKNEKMKLSPTYSIVEEHEIGDHIIIFVRTKKVEQDLPPYTYLIRHKNSSFCYPWKYQNQVMSFVDSHLVQELVEQFCATYGSFYVEYKEKKQFDVMLWIYQMIFSDIKTTEKPNSYRIIIQNPQ